MAAHRFPGGWVLSAPAVQLRRARPPEVGRPPSALMSWRLLSILSATIATGDLVAGVEPDAERYLIRDRRVRYRIRQLIAGAPPVHTWPGWLRRRAEMRRVWVHPGVLERMIADARLHPGGASAAAAVGVPVSAASSRRLYLREYDIAAVLDEYRARADSDGQLELMVVPSSASDHLPDAPARAGAPVPVAAALVDLLESPDAREHHVATTLLAAAAARATETP